MSVNKDILETMQKFSPNPGQALPNLLDQYRGQMPVLIELAEMSAKVRFANYQALVKAGFKHEDALFIVK